VGGTFEIGGMLEAGGFILRPAIYTSQVRFIDTYYIYTLIFAIIIN
jgi:hypothetical protein